MEERSLCRTIAGKAPAVWAVAILCLCLVGALVIQGVQQAQASVDVGKQDCSISVALNQELPEQPEEFVFDVYRIADAVADEGYDSYHFSIPENSSFKALDNLLAQATGADDASSADANGALAQAAARIALVENPGAGLYAENVASIADQLDTGLYLVIPHGRNIDNFVREVNGNLVTIAQSPLFEFSFAPMLISVPSRMSNGTNSTANTDVAWNYHISAEAKAQVAKRFGSLEIVKDLPTYENTDPATFVFQIEAYDNEAMTGTAVYSNVVSITFTNAGTRTELLENVIPAGSWVRVTEVYSGAVYEVQSAAEATATITADQVAQVAFTNTYNGTGNRGGAITNTFAYGDNNRWQWTPIADQGEVQE